jgi:hypothetical protein
MVGRTICSSAKIASAVDNICMVYAEYHECLYNKTALKSCKHCCIKSRIRKENIRRRRLKILIAA